ncbi:S9 family peptidase [Xylanimonas protaetiae]|uniref:S9 family peptidase n=1 Tax=Xylanimonas protaetiae TaxID=2509457 RepID=A0A4P6F9Y5_9MICO|nr:S9 family peptidase [Xylanimonas protaetiae]QAY71753.1 S9 family peptidase [Xylanimonas protaetiae]
MTATPVTATPVTAALVTPRRPVERTHHGDVVVDDYEWLRDADDPAVVAHLEAQDAWTRARLAHLEPLRERLFTEIKDRTLETDLSVPVRLGDHWYYARTVEGSQYAIHARVPAAPDAWTPPTLEPGVTPDPGSRGPGGGDEQVLLDENALAEGHEFFALGGTEVSADGRLLAYQVDVQGDERYVLRFRDLATGEDLPDVVEETSPGVALTPGPGSPGSAAGGYVFYTTVDDAWRPHRVWRHQLGTPAADDVLLLEEPDERFWVGVGLTRSRRFVQVELASKLTTEVWLVPADAPTSEPVVVWPRREGVEYSVEDAGDQLLVLHNDGAENFELVSVTVPDDLRAPGAFDAAGADVVVPHDPAVRLEGVDAFASHLVLSYRRDATPRVAVAARGPAAPRRMTGTGSRAASAGLSWREVSTGEALEGVQLDASPMVDQPVVRVVVESFVTPRTVYDVVLATGELLLRKRQPVLGGYDPAGFEQRRDWATAPDGTRVPVSLVWKRDPALPAGPARPAPVLLYGYGSYEYSLDPWFSVPRLSLLDRGVVFAVAHVRGGGELGRGWYDDGKLLAKRNTFTDFVAVAQHLVDTGWTTPQRLAAEGGSAGGLLVGAVANLAPQLFAGIHAAVPFVDPLTSILDPSLPLTVTEWEEWGNPLDDPDVYAYMKGYSPYENVPDDASAYPPILATTSLHDTRVLYVEPAKWVARLRAAGAPALLRIEMSAGHGGVSGRYSRWRQIAEENAWLLDVLGATEATRPGR